MTDILKLIRDRVRKSEERLLKKYGEVSPERWAQILDNVADRIEREAAESKTDP